MKSFLYQIAKSFYEEHGQNIRQFTFVFPNRRAGYFFQKYLSEQIDKVIFAPNVMAVNDLFYSVSDSKITDRTAELFRLYEIYQRVSGSKETFDDFVFWGEVLLSDFDDIDKYRIDAKQLFANVRDLKEIDFTFEYLSEEQRVAIKRFWEHFLPETDKATKKSFVEIWKVLFQLYDMHRSELRAVSLATEGMVFRAVVEQLENDVALKYFDDKKFVFVGFNALNPCEKALFNELKKRNQADFYWDYYAEELRDASNNASQFYEENIRNFPSALSLDKEKLTDTLSEKNFELYAVPSAIGQVKTSYQVLENISNSTGKPKNWLHTAVVLPDEKLLVPLLYSLPEHIDNINITMGYPLSSTPVVSLVDAIFALHRRSTSKAGFYHKSVTSILNHQLIYPICSGAVDEILQKIVENNLIYVDEKLFAEDKLLKLIFKQEIQSEDILEHLLIILNGLLEANKGFDDLTSDFIYQYYITINRLNDVMQQSKATAITLETLHRLLRQLIAGVTIPFEGEPLNGLQIMGTLETRGMDFENLIICSFNEGVFPKGNSSISFVPYTLRRAFNLPTEEYHDAIASYNFYRLIQRSKNVYFLYDSRSDGMLTGEVSRYLYQLQYHYGVEVKQHKISYDVKLPDEKIIAVHKTDEIMQKLQAFTSDEKGARWLSPSSINTYIDCPLKFYFSYVERLRETDEVAESVEAGMFGTLLHYVMEHIYKEYEGVLVKKEYLQAIRDNKILIDKLIRKAFAEEFFNYQPEDDISKLEIEGENLLVADVLKKQIRQILLLDIERAPFLYIQSEKTAKMKLPILGGEKEVHVLGKIDRVDEKNGIVRVVDYKTGQDKLSFKSLNSAFERNSTERPKVVLQTFLYSLLYQYDAKINQISPEVFKVRDIFKLDFRTQLRDSELKQDVDNFEDYKEEFVGLLTETVEEIFNPEVPFHQCEEIDLCKYCPFLSICHRFVNENSF